MLKYKTAIGIGLNSSGFLSAYIEMEKEQWIFYSMNVLSPTYWSCVAGLQSLA